MFVGSTALRLVSGLTITALTAGLVCAAAEVGEKASRQADPLAIYREAGATAEQETKIRQLAGDYEKSAKVRLQRIRNLSNQLKEESFVADLDEKKILGLQEEMNTLHTGLCLDRIKLLINIRQVLDSDQRAKLVQLMREKGITNEPPPKEPPVSSSGI